MRSSIVRRQASLAAISRQKTQATWNCSRLSASNNIGQRQSNSTPGSVNKLTVDVAICGNQNPKPAGHLRQNLQNLWIAGRSRRLPVRYVRYRPRQVELIDMSLHVAACLVAAERNHWTHSPLCSGKNSRACNCHFRISYQTISNSASVG